jgi:hypothetical protein
LLEETLLGILGDVAPFRQLSLVSMAKVYSQRACKLVSDVQNSRLPSPHQTTCD